MIRFENPQVTNNHSQVTNHMIQTYYLSQVTGCMHNITGHKQIYNISQIIIHAYNTDDKLETWGFTSM